MQPDSENPLTHDSSIQYNAESLGAHFEQFGSVADVSLTLSLNPVSEFISVVLQVVVMRNKATNQPRGFGFVTFRDKDAAERAIKTPHLIDGRSVDAKPSIPQQHTQHHMAHNISDVSMNGPRGRTRKLFVGGLPSELTVEELRSYFEAFGTITDSVIMIDQNTGRQVTLNFKGGLCLLVLAAPSFLIAIFSFGPDLEASALFPLIAPTASTGSLPLAPITSSRAETWR